jgi:glucose/arabinose dehydrogenase
VSRNRRWHHLSVLLFVVALSLAFTFAVMARDAASPPGLEHNGSLDLAMDVFVPAGTLTEPVGLVHAGDDRLFSVGRQGQIHIVQSEGTVLSPPFLDIGDRVLAGGEQGLLGLAFHPDYENNGTFYVNYTAQPDGDTHISRFSVTADPQVADPGSEVVLLTVDQPHANHNAGDLRFGPGDGFLYVPLGDGGSGNDPGNRAQNMQTLLGKILRIDVDGQAPGSADCGSPGQYTVPADNPFVDGAGGDCDEIWALGLRNPWRFSFDGLTGDMVVADVGQAAREEINVQPAASTGGENYGWSCYEGTRLNTETHMEDCGPASAYDMPVFEYAHNGNCTVIGGFVYRGARFPQMAGHYFLTDLCTGYVWDLDTENGWAHTQHDRLLPSGVSAASFGRDVDGELYLVGLSNGAVYHLRAGAEGEPTYLPLILGP